MITKIWTDDEELLVDTKDIGDLESAMRFKAEHIRAKADPELFVAVADSLSSVLDTASKAINPVTNATSINPPFSSVYLCSGMLPNQIEYADITKELK